MRLRSILRSLAASPPSSKNLRTWPTGSRSVRLPKTSKSTSAPSKGRPCANAAWPESSAETAAPTNSRSTRATATPAACATEASKSLTSSFFAAAAARLQPGPATIPAHPAAAPLLSATKALRSTGPAGRGLELQRAKIVPPNAFAFAALSTRPWIFGTAKALALASALALPLALPLGSAPHAAEAFAWAFGGGGGPFARPLPLPLPLPLVRTDARCAPSEPLPPALRGDEEDDEAPPDGTGPAEACSTTVTPRRCGKAAIGTAAFFGASATAWATATEAAASKRSRSESLRTHRVSSCPHLVLMMKPA
mmetsp:Transcript_102833/g.329850  ORF Transcript_102833/g.329850 Transcript_102833/m.329850 type:complete len:309 (-) Transcript_102833:361-1287(-)